MALPSFPQQTQYAPLTATGLQDRFGLTPTSPAHRTYDPRRATPRDPSSPLKDGQARDFSLADAPDDDDESAALTSDAGTASEEQEEDHCPAASRVVNSDWFKISVAVAILMSTFAIAGETDFPEHWIWGPLNELFIVFFTLEITLKLLVYHGSFFCNADWAWHWFDFGLVLFSWLDQMCQNSSLSNYLTLLRIVRILRILRVAKLFRDCDQLKKLATGLMESVGMVIWIMILMFIFMLIFSIFLTDVVGNQAFKFNDPAFIEEYFGGIIKTLVTLFQYLTLDNWSSITREVTDTLPWMRIFFTAYIGIGAFAMLSLLTGVIVDHMTEVSAAQQEEDKAEAKEELELFVSGLKRYFTKNASTQFQISHEDLVKLLQDKELRDTLDRCGVSLAGHEVREFFLFLDRDGNGMISMSEFETGMLRLREEKPRAQDILRIRYAAERVAKHLEGGDGEAATMKKLTEVNELMSSVDERLAVLQRQLRGFMTFARTTNGRRSTLVEMLGGSRKSDGQR